MSLTKKTAQKLHPIPEILELDVTCPEHFRALTTSLKEKWGRVDGALHSIAFAPADALGGHFLDTPWESVCQAFRISTFSFKELAVALAPLMPNGGSLVGLDFDNSQVAWPGYDWMGVCKAALASCARYLAAQLGPQRIRINLVSAGPLATVAARSIQGFTTLAKSWTQQAPLPWQANDNTAVAQSVCALLSDLLPATTAEVLHVDGGVHAVAPSFTEAANPTASPKPNESFIPESPSLAQQG